MSTSPASPPTEPARPRTPPPAEPAFKVTLPTPPSFAARRGLSYSKESPPSPQSKADRHVRSVSFSLNEDQDDERKVYRIPQRSKGEDAAGNLTAPPTIRHIPKPLNLPSRTAGNGVANLLPHLRAPATAPHARFAHTSSGQGISAASAFARGARRSTSGGASRAGGSIWSAGLNPNTASGWISPALNSARSVGTATRQRGLTVAVLKDGSEMLVGDVPLTPGLPTPKPPKSGGLIGSAPFRGAIPEEKDEVLQDSPTVETEGKPDVVILCRYYHTPGLTCTSRPCRFVHNLDTLKSPKSVDQYEMKSPNADPTGGTFAQAQLKAQAKILNVDELVNNGAAPGETVVLSSGEGHEIVGTVYLMSGGGKGPAGKSRSKFKTVPCKDFAEGFCQYGEYCSFIHEEKTATQRTPAEIKVEDTRRHSTGTAAAKPTLDAWKKALPESVLVPAVTVEGLSLDRQKRRLSAFAAPYSTAPLRVDEKGQLVSDLQPEPIGATNLYKPKIPPARSSVWAKGPPLTLKKVSIVEPTNDSDAARTHLAPPVSAVSMFGTESDPATPWDPAMRRKFEEEENSQDLSDAVFTPPSPFPSPPIYAPRVPKWQSPAYPWGMPMSPTSPLSDQTALANIPGGPGVMWTPTGWAVQDAAMKHSLRAAEMKAKDEHAKARGKSYYKTRVCKYYLEGSCPHGENCTYVHDGPLGTQPPKSTKHRVLPCKFYNSAGGCSNGDKCDFLHAFVVPASVPLVDKPRPWRTKPCRHYQLGRCSLGDACHFAHVLDPTHRSIETDKICRHWVRGQCEKGASCKFKHEGIMEEHLTEARLARAFEAMRTKTYREVCDDEDDDVEIVTQETGTQVSFSPASSLMT